jgi:hypothetical protein
VGSFRAYAVCSRPNTHDRPASKSDSLVPDQPADLGSPNPLAVFFLCDVNVGPYAETRRPGDGGDALNARPAMLQQASPTACDAFVISANITSAHNRSSRITSTIASTSGGRPRESLEIEPIEMSTHYAKKSRILGASVFARS